MNNRVYVDDEHPLGDATILRNAVYFSTAQRSYSTNLLLQQPIEVHGNTLGYLVIKSYEDFMTSSEDVLGWFFALLEWEPGKIDTSLIYLLSNIMVGKNAQYSEARAVALLKEMDDDTFRKSLHIPDSEELMASGLSKEVVDRIERSMAFKRAGLLKIAERRAEQDRGWVKMFNKFKHFMLAFPFNSPDGQRKIWLPTHIKYDKKRNRVLLGRGELDVSVNLVRRHAGDAIAAQAILCDTLATILMTRYGEEFVTPQWILQAYHTDYFWQ